MFFERPPPPQTRSRDRKNVKEYNFNLESQDVPFLSVAADTCFQLYRMLAWLPILHIRARARPGH
jgi:hypothetical protein